MAAVRFAFIGCGNIAQFHLRALRESTHLAEVTAAVDVRRASAEKFSSLLQAPCKVGGANSRPLLPCTHALSHMHSHTRTPTHALSHMHSHTCTPTHALSHMHSHTCRYSHHCVTLCSGGSLMRQCSWFLTISMRPTLCSAWRPVNMFCWKSPWHTHWTLVRGYWEQQKTVTVCSWLGRTPHTGLRLNPLLHRSVCIVAPWIADCRSVGVQDKGAD